MCSPFTLDIEWEDDSGMHRQPILNALRRYALRHPTERDVVARFVAFVESEPRCFERDCWRGHVTGSAWVVDGTGTRVLLTHHRKLGRWLQLGGHSDGDPDSFAVAMREAMEESGLVVTPITTEIFDVDIHPIPARGTDPEHAHYDARYAFRIVGSETFTKSDESHALEWVPITAIERYTDEPSMLRMARKMIDETRLNV
jgi:8-oxo-dGTP pyrophosphatase MutT (NUDIX family)